MVFKSDAFKLAYMTEEEEFDFNGLVLQLSEAAISKKAIDKRSCFMCGGPATKGYGEHVFPKWLQNEFGLHDQTLNLLNGTRVPYRQLRSPCCEDCNTGPLSRLEKRVIALRNTCEVMDYEFRLEIGRWLFKILLGILYAESRFHFDRANPNLGSIMPSEAFDDLFTMHLLVNSSRKKAMFHCLHGELPFTIYTYNITQSEHFSEFDFSTNLAGMSVAIRMGNVGAIAVHDGGLQYEVGERGPFDLAGSTLHPFQFSEVSARVHYKSALRSATHLYFNSESPGQLTMIQSSVRSDTQELLADGAERIFWDWKDKEAGMVLEQYTRVSDWYSAEDDRVNTYLLD